MIYMGVAQLEDICAKLMDMGRDPATAAAIVERATTPEHGYSVSTLAQLPQNRLAQPVKAPALIVVGNVVNLHGKLDWFGNAQHASYRRVRRVRHPAPLRLPDLRRVSVPLFQPSRSEWKRPARDPSAIPPSACGRRRRKTCTAPAVAQPAYGVDSGTRGSSLPHSRVGIFSFPSRHCPACPSIMDRNALQGRRDGCRA